MSGSSSNGATISDLHGSYLRKEQLKKWKILEDVPDFLLDHVKIAAVTSKSAFLVTFNDSVFAIGDNRYGTLGFDWASVKHIPGRQPKRNDLLSSIGVIEFAIGNGFALARTRSGEIYSMGNNEGELGLGHRNPCIGPKRVFGLEGHYIVKIRCGRHHSVCMTSKGQVFAWGPCSFGKNGRQAILNVIYPRLVEFPEDVSIVSVECTENSSIAWTKDGKVYGWGSNANGELGVQPSYDVSSPIEIQFPDGILIKKVVCGATHCVALATDGSMYAWGRDFSSEIDNFSQIVSIPAKLTWMPDRVVDVESNWRCRSTTCRTSSRVFAFGDFKRSNVSVPAKTQYDNLGFTNDDSCMYENWDSSNHASSSNSRGSSSVKADSERAESASPLSQQDNGTEHIIEFSVEGKIIRGWKPTLDNCKRLQEQLELEYQHGYSGLAPLEIKNFGFEEFRAFIKYLHTDTLDIEDGRLIELVDLADNYQENGLRQIAAKRLGNSVRIENAIDIYSTALKYGDLELRISALTFIASEFWQIMQNPIFTSAESYQSVGGSIITDLKQMNLLTTTRGGQSDEEFAHNDSQIKLPEAKNIRIHPLRYEVEMGSKIC